MVSTFTTNINLEEPARGDDVGTWDTPVNANMTLLDLIAGGVTTISGAAGSVVLSAAQYQCKTITVNSTLIASIFLTFPTSFKKSYEIQNICTGSSAFTITLQTTASGAGGQYVCCPPGEIIDVLNDGTNIKYKNLGRVGEYMIFAGSSVPNWISGCAVPPYLNCDGTAFSATTYPALAARIGTTLPDARGRTLYTLDQGLGRVSSAVSGVAGNTILTGAGDQQTQAHVHVNSLNESAHVHQYNNVANASVLSGGGSFGTGTNSVSNTGAAVTGITITNANFGSGAAQNMPPLLVAGLTMIRAA